MMKNWLAIISFALLLGVASALAPSVETNPTVINTSNSTNGNGPSIGCIKARWNADDYCLWTGDASKEQEAQKILPIIKAKMLETVPEGYFDSHFDLHYVTIESGEFDFSYRVGDYGDINYGGYLGYLPTGRDLDYSVRVKSANGAYIVVLIPPRPITDVVGKDVLFSESRKCIGTTDLEYVIADGFRLVAKGSESIPADHNHFEMDLETGNASCSLVTTVTHDGSPSSGRARENVPCYDCWKEYSFAAVSIGAVVILAAFIWHGARKSSPPNTAP